MGGAIEKFSRGLILLGDFWVFIGNDLGRHLMKYDLNIRFLPTGHPINNGNCINICINTLHWLKLQRSIQKSKQFAPKISLY